MRGFAEQGCIIEYSFHLHDCVHQWIIIGRLRHSDSYGAESFHVLFQNWMHIDGIPVMFPSSLFFQVKGKRAINHKCTNLVPCLKTSR